MKIGVIGAGAVGSACVLSTVMRGCAREIVVLNRDRKRAVAVATDMQYSATLSPAVDIRDGDYPDLTGAGLVMLTAGVNEKTGGVTDRSDPTGRLKLLDQNVDVYRQIAIARNSRRTIASAFESGPQGCDRTRERWPPAVAPAAKAARPDRNAPIPAKRRKR
jgi:malate/lactate dehydrogenase